VHLGGGRVTGRPTGRTRTREAALVVFSGPRSPEPSLIRSLPGARTTVLGTLAVEGRTMVALPGRVFAAGEVTSGPRTVVDAVASGIRAARGVLEFIEVTP